MDRIPDDLIRLGAFDADQCVGILVFYPLLEWLMSLVVTAGHRRRGVASLLLNALMVDLPGRVNKVKITNIDHSDTGMKKFIESAGAKWVIDQFEMEYRLDQGSD
jgi:GNAT superfamily N-acetyltransferase